PSAAAVAGQQGHLRREHGTALGRDGAAGAGDDRDPEGVRVRRVQGHRGSGGSVRGGAPRTRAPAIAGELREGGAGAVMPRWLAAFAGALLVLGLAGFSGSSWLYGLRIDRLFTAEERQE